MATNFRRFGAAASLAAGLLSPLPAVAEIPRTTAEWLAVYKERQARFDAVEIESHWQRLEGEKVVEEWDQKFYADDLGQSRLEEFGRLELDTRRPEVGIVTDTVLAFDGAEYRELERRWEYAFAHTPSWERIAALRRTPPRIHQGRIESEAHEFSAIRRAETPIRWADYWFLVCLTHAAQEGLEPEVSTADGRPDLLEVAFNSRSRDWGRTCRAWVAPGQEHHVARIDLSGSTGWAARYEAEYVLRNATWLPCQGSYVPLDSPVQADQPRPKDLRFVVLNATLAERRVGRDILPSFPLGTWLADFRTNATFRVGLENESDQRMDSLVASARSQYEGFAEAKKERARTRPGVGPMLAHVAVGAGAGAVLSGIVRMLRSPRWRPKAGTHE